MDKKNWTLLINTASCLLVFLSRVLGDDTRSDIAPESSSQSDSSLHFISNLAFLNASQASIITIPSVLNLRQHTAFSFRTCSSGSLFHQSGATGSWLRLDLTHQGALLLSWRDSSTENSDSIEITNSENSFSSNQWFTVDISFNFGQIYVSVEQGPRLLQQVLLSNITHNAYLWSLDLSAELPLIRIGEGYTGCFQGGPGLYLSHDGADLSTVVLGDCPLDGSTGCGSSTEEDPCWRYPCQNGGTCVHSVRGEIEYTCTCPPPYSGLHCEEDLGHLGCDLRPCINGGECLPTENTTRKYQCQCPPGFTGVNCQIDIDECGPRPCQNAGVCIDDINAYRCNCSETGFDGIHCEVNLNECLVLAPCENGAICSDTPGSYKCQCPFGFSGRNCQEATNECQSNPCQNGASCLDMLGYFLCQCPAGFTGNLCEENIDECQDVVCDGPNMQCVDLIAGYECICHAGYHVSPDGAGCVETDDCESAPCFNGGLCHDRLDGFSCECVPGFAGDACQINVNECLHNSCKNGATCVDGVNSYHCECPPGYTDEFCTTLINLCDAQPCLNRASCTPHPGYYECYCAPGFHGDRCEHDADECGSRPCQHSARCEDLVNSYLCHCEPDFYGVNCQHKRSVDMCDLQPCQNEATCMPTPSGGYSCMCPLDWMGRNCTEEYNACAFTPCQNNGNCSTNPREHRYICTCPPGFEGDQCQINIDDCSGVTCPSPQLCVDGANTYTCRCPIGYSGDSCTTIANDCHSTPCLNGGECIPSESGFRCNCAGEFVNHTRYSGNPEDVYWIGFSGAQCEVDVNECDYASICLNNGICKQTNDTEYGFRCYCGMGGEYFTGKYCQDKKDYCAIVSSPDPPACHNGGTCQDIGDDYRCLCGPGFTGPRCKTNLDECASAPCLHGATCIDGNNGYRCVCMLGFTGDQCQTEINECDTNPCLNGGQCIDRINGYDCNCTMTGYEGRICEVDINECLSSPCKHGSLCINNVNSFSCVCNNGYTGPECEIDFNECFSSPCQNNGTCIERSEGDTNPEFDFKHAEGFDCTCVKGFSGVFCEVNIDECEGHSCVYGECVDGINGYVCVCNDGYTGLSCDIEINECTLFKPCQFGSECFNKVADYDCVCAPEVMGVQYGGKNCSVTLTGCANNTCQNGATCVPTYAEAIMSHDYTCDCPPGHYGAYCELNTTASFYGNSWLQFNETFGVSELILTFRFQTTLPNGLLFLNLRAIESGTNYVLLQLLDGTTLQLNYVNPQETRTLQVSVPTTLVDGTLRGVKITVDYLKITLTLYHEDCYEGECIDNKELLAPGAQPPAGQPRHHPLGISWFGGNKTSHPVTNNIQEFTGCMQDIVVNSQMIIPSVYVANTSTSNLGVGCPRVEECGVNPCSSHGNCSDLWFDFSCSCWRPYFGDNCNKSQTPGTFGNEQTTSSAVFTIPDDTDHQNDLKTRNDVSFFFRTRKEAGLLYYLGDRSKTHFALDLSEGLLRVRVRLGGAEQICDQSSLYVTNGDQHYIHVIRDSTNIKFWLKRVILGEDPTVDLESEAFNCKIIELVNLLNASFLYVGSSPPSPPEGTGTPGGRRKRQAVIDLLADLEPFKGTIQDIQQNGFDLPLFATNETTAPSYDVPVTYDVLPGEISDDMCAQAPCANNATCENTFFNDYTCTCPEGFRGKNCSELDFCVYNFCPLNATCNSLDDGYECVTDATFNGGTSFVKYSNSLNTTTDINEIYVEFRTRNLSAALLHVRGTDSFAANYITVELLQGFVILSFDLGNQGRLNSSQSGVISDGDWHNLTVTIQNGGIILKIDGVDSAASNLQQNITLFSIVKNSDSIYLAGVPKDYITNYPGMFETSDPFKGCMEEVRIGGYILPFFDQSDLENNTSAEIFTAEVLQDVTVGCRGDPVCETDLCENNSTCDDLWNDYQCLCLPGFNGSYCEVDIDECVGHECKNNATCVDGIANYTCVCPLGYTGDRCEIDIDECESSPCWNNGTCLDLVGRYECNCSTNYTGVNCQIDIRENCDMNPDLCNNGTCLNINMTDGVQTFNCTCDPGITGRYCDTEIDYCEGAPCLNNATCLSSTQLLNYTCQCAIGYTGRDCETDIDECASSPCKNNAQCIDEIGFYTCNCTSGWEDVNCDLDIDECNVTASNGSVPCDNGFCQNEPGYYLCNCTGSGFQGPRCEQDIDECNVTSTCKNNATCTNFVGDYSCNCTLGYEGKDCAIANCSVAQCLNNGTCGVSNTGQWFCDCPEFVEGYQCESPGPCVERPCVNNATCSQKGDNYTCTCTPGWEGKNCESDINECDRYAPCQNNGTCNNTEGWYECTCLPGFTDDNCTTDINECESNPCLNGGQCQDRINSYFCDCTDTGYSGSECQEDVDECLLAPPCLNGGTCTNLNGTFNCTCTELFVGATCHSNNPCIELECYNGGTCQVDNVDDINLNATGACLCSDPWYGPNCEFTFLLLCWLFAKTSVPLEEPTAQVVKKPLDRE